MMSRHHRSALLRAPRREADGKDSAMSAATQSKFGFWTPWATVAFLAVVAGLMLPQLMPGETIVEKPRAKAEAPGKTSEYTAPSLPDMPSPQALLGRLVIGTIFVLGLSVVSLWGVRRWIQTNAPDNATPHNLRLIETLQLGNRCSLHLVYLGKREVLIGVDGAGIKTVVPLATSFDEVLAETGEVPTDAATPFPTKIAG